MSLAREARMSRSVLALKLKTVLGQTLLEYLKTHIEKLRDFMSPRWYFSKPRHLRTLGHFCRGLSGSLRAQ